MPAFTCPPSVNLLCHNALAAIRRVQVPFCCRVWIFMLNRADILHICAECSRPDNAFSAWRLLSGIMHSIAAAVFGALVHVLSTACACAE